MGKPQETRLIGTDGQFSWAQMWTYFKSDICTDDMRAFTLQSISIVDVLKGVMPEVQFEIMQYAPKELMNHPAIVKVLDQRIVHELRPYGMNAENDFWNRHYLSEWFEELIKEKKLKR